MVCLGYRSKQFSRVLILTACLLAWSLGLVCAASGPAPAAEVWEKTDLMQPEELAAVLSDPNQEKPVVVFMGFDFLFRAAHIPGALYFGPGSKVSGVEGLKRWAGSLEKDRAVVLYCGCCPWKACPNIRAAFNAVRRAGHASVKALYLKSSMLEDWVDKDYPVEKGR